MTDTAPTSPTQLSDQSKAFITRTVEAYVIDHPVLAAKQLSYLNRMDERGRLDAYDAFRRDALAAQLLEKHACEDCGRPLETEESKARGVGPDCLEKREQARG